MRYEASRALYVNAPLFSDILFVADFFASEQDILRDMLASFQMSKYHTAYTKSVGLQQQNERA